MSRSSFGNRFTVTTWGESHGKALGAVVDGCPAGLPLQESDIQYFLDRRKPGQSRYTTSRQEGDQVAILSGVFQGHTTGTPISMIVWNKDQQKTMGIWPIPTAQAMQTSVLTRNTASVITVAVDVLLAVKL